MIDLYFKIYVGGSYGPGMRGSGARSNIPWPAPRKISSKSDPLVMFMKIFWAQLRIYIVYFFMDQISFDSYILFLGVNEAAANTNSFNLQATAPLHPTWLDQK